MPVLGPFFMAGRWILRTPSDGLGLGLVGGEPRVPGSRSSAQPVPVAVRPLKDIDNRLSLVRYSIEYGSLPFGVNSRLKILGSAAPPLARSHPGALPNWAVRSHRRAQLGKGVLGSLPTHPRAHGLPCQAPQMGHIAPGRLKLRSHMTG